MKSKHLMDVINDIDADMIEDAARKRSRFTPFVKWGSLSAGMVVLLAAGAFLIPLLKQGEPASIDGIDRTYKNSVLSQSELGVQWPWEYKTVYEKFPTVTYNGRKYTTRSQPIRTALLDGSLGTCTADGYDIYTEQTYTEQFELRSINGISPERMLAVGSNEHFYVYFSDTTEKPPLWGELLDTYSLMQTLRFDQFSVCESYREKGHYSLSDDTPIREILASCRDAKLSEGSDYPDRSQGTYLSFTATSEALGVYKRVFYVTSDGYISTNIFDYAYTYFIGTEAAEGILNYANANAVEVTPEPYEYSLAGLLTKIGDGYILVDDTPLCKNPKDGTVFKILTDDPRLRRCIVCTDIQIGDMVVVKWQGNNNDNADRVITGAHSMSRGILSDDGVAVLE